MLFHFNKLLRFLNARFDKFALTSRRRVNDIGTQDLSDNRRIVLSGSGPATQCECIIFFFQSAHFYNVIPGNPIVLASPNETVRRESRYLSVARKQLPMCDRALNTRAQARRFLFRRVIEYAELTPERDIADNGRLRIAQRVYSLNENKSSSIATAVRLCKISLRIMLLPAALCISLFSFLLPLFFSLLSRTQPRFLSIFNHKVLDVVTAAGNTMILRENMLDLIRYLYRDIPNKYQWCIYECQIFFLMK